MIRRYFLLALLISSFYIGNAQGRTDNLANKIANRMKDSLSLTPKQQSAVYDINVELQEKKAAARKQTTDRAATGVSLQRIENTRDSLYRTVLTEQQFILYKQKKRNLVNNK